ncbi:hypothetical protein SK128_026079, partial [Halocaridina rubra]
LKQTNCFSWKTFERHLPCIKWMKTYDTDCLMGDIVSGLTLGLMVIPQSLSYATVSGLTPNYGLYSAFISSFVYLIFGSTNVLNIGPTAIMSIMIFQYANEGGADYAVLLCFLSGVMQLLAGIINLGFLVNYISEPVISGFTSAAALAIATSQMKSLLGQKLKTRGIVDTWIQVFSHLNEVRWQDALLGVTCIVVLSLMKRLRTTRFPCMDSESKSPRQRFLRQVLFFLTVGRNALVVVVATLIAFSLKGEHQPFTLTGFVEAGIPHVTLPPFSTVIGNETVTFQEMISDIGVGVIMVPFIGLLINVATVSTFAKGKPVDTTQEILTLGLCNFLGGFVRSMPVTANLSRTAVNRDSGAKTPAGGLITGIMVLLALSFLTPAFYYIPISTLAAMIICAVMNMVDYDIVLTLWKIKPADILPFIVTFFGCLLTGLEWGIIMGIAVNVAMLLYASAKPAVKISLVPSENEVPKFVIATPSHGVSFPGTSHLRNTLRKAGMKQGEGKLPVVIDCCYIDTADYTSVKGIKNIIEDFQRRSQPLYFVEMKPEIQKMVTVIHEDITACPSFDILNEILAGERRVNNTLQNSEHTVNNNSFDRKCNNSKDEVISNTIFTIFSETANGEMSKEQMEHLSLALQQYITAQGKVDSGKYTSDCHRNACTTTDREVVINISNSSTPYESAERHVNSDTEPNLSHVSLPE